jgi:protein-tyrosine phosphatase
MIDIHSHIIFGVDDGAKNREETEAMLMAAKSAGICEIIATPHFRGDTPDNDYLSENYQLASRVAEKYGISLILGHEVMINPLLPQMIAEGKKLTLNNSRFLLIEFPFLHLPHFTVEVLYKLKLIGIIPIIAHPERYEYFIRNYQLFCDFCETGYMMQIDAASIIGYYGRRVKRFIKKALIENRISFIASDAHSKKGYSEWYPDACNKVEKWIGIDKANQLLNENAKMIVQSNFITL